MTTTTLSPALCAADSLDARSALGGGECHLQACLVPHGTFVGGEDYLRQRGVEGINLDSQECVDLMNEFIAAHPDIWYEHIGED
jgi:hypothetical protein